MPVKITGYNGTMSIVEEELWESLAKLDPAAACSRCDVSYETLSGNYLVNSFTSQISVSSSKRELLGNDHTGHTLLNELGSFSRLSILWYLIGCKDIRLENSLVNPSTLPGGDIFLRGTHVLPLERLGNRFSSNIPKFHEVGEKLGGTRADLADAAVQLHPFPKIPVHVLFWEGNEEFPANASILFDTTCQFQMPIDIIWAIAMLSVEMMIRVD